MSGTGGAVNRLRQFERAGLSLLDDASAGAAKIDCETQALDCVRA
jgi:hypothetical protein